MINDKKIPEFEKTDMPETGLVAFNADVLSYSDYYPFGMLQDARHGSKANYRYGFNGMEKDDELKGEGNSYDFGARMYDSRVGRWFAVDPLAHNFPFESQYGFTSQNPIIYNDPDGKNKYLTINILDENTGIRTEIKIVIDTETLQKVRRDVGPKGHAEYVYDWHDINIIHNVIRKKDGSFEMDGNAKKVLGDKKTTTPFDWGESYANTQAQVFSLMEEKPSKWSGGIAWYSKNGQGEEVRIGKKENVQFEEGDGLISLIKGGRNIGFNGPKSLEKVLDNATLDKIHKVAKKIAEGMKLGMTIAKTSEKIQKKNDKILQKKREFGAQNAKHESSNDAFRLSEPDSVTRTYYNKDGDQMNSERIKNPIRE
ncbi:RHS repeat-associated core domain-containing protein [Flavobacterium sp. WV_118_3]|uniref:RHS repeat domain-containing protein n=1 Tax=Flavobacterium sp. WV_118_3 TaxID=3151764 RepID=UPI00321994E2